MVWSNYASDKGNKAVPNIQVWTDDNGYTLPLWNNDLESAQIHD